jgi:hypothetical protein
LLDAFYEDVVDKTQIKELIKRRRLQMLIHSCLYYELNESILSDDTWQKWADELQKLQEDNPDCLVIDCWDYEFRDWDGATGAHLPHRHPWVYNKAKYIYNRAIGVEL